MINLVELLPIIVLIFHFALMIFCLLKLSKENTTRYWSKQIWTL